MNTIKRYIFFISVITLVFLGSCQDQLDVEPEGSLTVNEALSDFEGIETALIGVYSGLRSSLLYGRNLLVMPEASGDNVVLAIENSNRFTQNASYQWSVDNGDVTGIWNALYTIILRVNTVINNIDGVTGGTQTERNQVLGEALFIRALAHFELVRGFAQPISIGGTSSLGVPIVRQSVVGEPPRNTVGEVYIQITSDLVSATNLMNNDLAPFRASQDAARALLSRVYLYMEDNVNVISQATKVIDSGNYGLDSISNYIESWAFDGTIEEIFTVKFLATETLGASNLGNIYIPEGFGDLRASQDIIVELSGPGDVRIQFIRDIGGDEYQYKFPGILNIPGLASPRLLRLAEMYLNRAEAYAKIGNYPDAIIDLNTIRTTRGLAAIFPQNTQVLNEVLLERRRELAWEGHRTYDLFRNKQDLLRIECNAISICDVAAGSDFTIWPIPDREIKVNPNIVQNPGYN